MTKKSLTANDIDAILPQTQCGLCEHAGCMPYAEAIINNNDAIDRCLPGGVRVLKQLATLTEQDATPLISGMEAKAKPAQKVVIREAECIGCKKCIQACPVDAIIGTSKLMHTVIADICTGCELCIEPCPMDCIDIVPSIEVTEKEQLLISNASRERYLQRNDRLKRLAIEKKQQHIQAKSQPHLSAIQAAVARAKAKKDNQS